MLGEGPMAKKMRTGRSAATSADAPSGAMGGGGGEGGAPSDARSVKRSWYSAHLGWGFVGEGVVGTGERGRRGLGRGAVVLVSYPEP